MSKLLLFSYIPGSSILHTLDPRTKILSFMFLSIIIFHSNSFLALFIIGLLIVLLHFLSKIPLKVTYKSIHPLLIFLFFIFIAQVLSSNGTAIFVIGNIRATYEGLILGALFALKFVYLLAFAALFTATTMTSVMTVAVGNLLKPLHLKYIGISSFDIATMMYLSIHFLPFLHENYINLKDAQYSRGLNLTKNPIKTVYCFVIPMIESCLRLTEEITYALESRCYQGVYRTSMHKLKMKKIDYAALLLIGCCTLIYLVF